MLSICGLSLAFSQSVEGQVANKVIYKWRENGVVFYSTLKPQRIKEFTRLLSQGERIEKIGKTANKTMGEKLPLRPKQDITHSDQLMEEDKPKSTSVVAKNQKNCQIARKNQRVLESGNAYEYGENGQLIHLNQVQITERKRQAQKNIDYFCHP